MSNKETTEEIQAAGKKRVGLLEDFDKSPHT
jgi:hypothetical protein